jgi:hypothetical protein
MTASQTTTAPAVIHQKRLAMRAASRPAGSSDDWTPPQPATSSAHATNQTAMMTERAAS